MICLTLNNNYNYEESYILLAKTQKLMKQGFWYTGLCMAFRKFARSQVGIITKYGCSVRKHIEERICLPATDAFLSHITLKILVLAMVL